MAKKSTSVFDHSSKGEEYSASIESFTTGELNFDALNSTPLEECPTVEVVDLINQIFKKFNLTFISKKETNGNICFANNPELRNEFRTTFSATDVLNYINAISYSSSYKDKNKSHLMSNCKNLPTPHNQDTFWKLVIWGGKIKKLQVSKKSLSEIDKIVTEINTVEFD